MLYTGYSGICFWPLTQILDFRTPGATAPVASAVGASIALDKICIAVAAMEEPVRLVPLFCCLIFLIGHLRACLSCFLSVSTASCKLVWCAGGPCRPHVNEQSH